jgi:hypothetical protein
MNRFVPMAVAAALIARAGCGDMKPSAPAADAAKA